MLRVTFQPHNKTASIAAGASIMDAARQLGLLAGALKAPCGGQGVCGRCQVRILSGSLNGQGPASPDKLYLACAAYPESDLTVELLPDPGWQHAPMPATLPSVEFVPTLQAIDLTLRPPAKDDNLNDADRLLLAIKAQGMDNATLHASLLPALPSWLRQHNWQCRAWLLQPENQVLHLSALGQKKCLLAIDLGTTSLWLQLIDADSGKMLAESSSPNPQAGEDVISRMLAATSPQGARSQQQAVLEGINQLAGQMLAQLGLTTRDIGLVAIAGNTVMSQMLLGMDCRPLRLEPYVPAVRQYPLLDAAHIGLNANAPLLLMPCPGSYVGGDIVAGVLATGLDTAEQPALFIDLGTNGEVALGNREWMIAAAASAGPAFEGGGISCGMAYAPGAIHDFNLHGTQPLLSIVGNEIPRGICGSGLISLVATLLQHGIITPDGRLQDNAANVRQGEYGLEYVLSKQPELAVNQADLQNFLQAKAAVYAALSCLLAAVGLNMDDLDKIILAGSFGNSLNLEQAIAIGLLPELPLNRFSYAGNSSLAGARAVMLNRHMRQQSRHISSRITNLELAGQPDYMNHYTAALFFPHTQAQTLFPRTWQQMRKI